MFRPVKTRKIYEEIVEQIKKLIVDGKLQPGDKLLSERELSEKLNVSRASVREAFSALEMMGIISIRPGEGSFVRQVSYEGMLEPLSFLLQMEIDDILQLLEVRKILEVETVALAAVRATPEDIEQIRSVMDSMIDEANTGELDTADAAFHFAIGRAANNAVLIKVMNTISDLMTNTFRSSRQRLFLVENMPQLLHQSHLEIFQAIIQKNPDEARRKMRDHLFMVEEAMKRLKTVEKNSLQEVNEYTAEHIRKKGMGFSS
jgi:GntR family transcriptional repressor for pyruvate dehydrogenase complex